MNFHPTFLEKMLNANINHKKIALKEIASIPKTVFKTLLPIAICLADLLPDHNCIHIHKAFFVSMSLIREILLYARKTKYNVRQLQDPVCKLFEFAK